MPPALIGAGGGDGQSNIRTSLGSVGAGSRKHDSAGALDNVRSDRSDGEWPTIRSGADRTGTDVVQAEGPRGQPRTERIHAYAEDDRGSGRDGRVARRGMTARAKRPVCGR